MRSETDGRRPAAPDAGPDARTERAIEVFADVACPFTHVGLRRLVERRRALGRDDVPLVVRAWPLELVNGAPMDPAFIAEEVAEIREQSAREMFVAFRQAAFPSTSLPALALVAAGYRRSRTEGEVLSLLLREALFEHGIDIADPAVLGRIAAAHDLVVGDEDHEAVHADLRAGAERGVIGSPHFFTPTGDFFCPALQVRRDDEGRLQVHADPEAFDAFVDSCFPDAGPSRA